jgi:hypothetical protein
VASEIHQCAECVELLGDYLDGALPPDRAAALERHLSLCMPCITFVRTYKATSRLAREKLASDMPPELSSSLHQFLSSAIPGFTCQNGGEPGGCGGMSARTAKKS